MFGNHYIPKLFLSFTLLFLFAFTSKSLVFCQDSDFQYSFLRADANSDGTVDISDAIFTLSWLFLGEESPSCKDASDSNDDGLTDLTDPINTLSTLFRGTNSIPYPGTENCDRDPTLDDLDCLSYPPCSCGGFIGKPCEKGSYCELPPDTCNSSDLQGTCLPQPFGCPRIWDPVCGCDGETYGNDCERRSVGVALHHRGECGSLNQPLEFRTLARDTSSGSDPREEIIRDADTWNDFWTEHQSISFPPSNPPQVDFETHMVIAIVTAETSGGFHLAIDEVVKSENNIVVHFVYIQPSGECPTTDALTQPFHFIVVPQTEGNLETEMESRLICCSLPMKAQGVGLCEKILGYRWNGVDVELLSGCDCEGEDCDKLFSSPAEVLEAFFGCPLLPE